MRYNFFLTGLFLAFLIASPATAQDEEGGKRFKGYVKASADDFEHAKPAIGEQFPELKIFTPDGKEFDTASLRGNYTVVTLGCLTCPPFLGNVPGLEGVYRDYAPRGVKFYFVYRSVAHPELRGNYLQTFTLQERLSHANQAAKQLGSSIPWLVDAMDNRLKHAVGNRANSEFLIDPEGKVVRKRMWSNPEQVRKDLEELVGKVEPITRPEDVKLTTEPPIVETAPRGTVERISRAGMFPVVMDPHTTDNSEPFFAKLRAEADLTLLDTGRGRLYLGFHLDPLYYVHWNKLYKPLAFQLELPEDAKFSAHSGQAPKTDAEADCDPREFMLDVDNWPADKPITLNVVYAVCKKNECHVVQQSYVLMRERDRDGGRAGPAGFRGAMKADEFVEMLLQGDRNGDGKIARQEMPSLLRKSFTDTDRNGDGLLDKQEMRALAEEQVSFLPRNRD